MEITQLPLVSIIITSYNRATLIPKTIESALAQDYPNLEIIISDNCSTDETDTVIRKYTSDSRIKYSRNEINIGMLPNFRKATYELSKGDYITYVSSDDYLTDNSFISDAMKLVGKYDNVNLVFGKLLGESSHNGNLWQMPDDPFFLKEIWDGKDVFFKSAETFLLSWGACLMGRKAMLKVKSLEVDFFNFDMDSNYKIMLTGNVGFINKFCYLHLGHGSNHGFPVNAEQIIRSLKCYEGIADFAIMYMPDERNKTKKWRDHFILFTISWAFYHLKENSETEYLKFRKGAIKEYPNEYQQFIRSSKYIKFVLSNSLKKILPLSSIKLIRRVRKKLFAVI